MSTHSDPLPVLGEGGASYKPEFQKFSIESIPSLSSATDVGASFSQLSSHPDRVLLYPVFTARAADVVDALHTMATEIFATDIFATQSLPDGVSVPLRNYRLEPAKSVLAIHRVARECLRRYNLFQQTLNAGSVFEPTLISMNQYDRPVEIFIASIALVRWNIYGNHQVEAIEELREHEDPA